MRTKLVGDGCSSCNPELAKQIEGDNFDDFISDVEDVAENLLNSICYVQDEMLICGECINHCAIGSDISHDDSCPGSQAEDVLLYIKDTYRK